MPRHGMELQRLEDRAVPAIIAGNIFADVNNNGILNPGEVGVAGQTVFLDANNNGVLDATNLPPVDYFGTGAYPILVPNTPAFFEDPITVSGSSGTIADVNVTVSFTHQWTGDIAIRLVAPDGTEINLMGDGVNFGGSGTNIDVTFDDQAATTVPDSGTPPGTYKPLSPLSVLNGKTADGVWKLKFFDVFTGGDTGTLNSWSLNITTAVGEVAVVSAANGDYSFSGLADGSYNVRYNAPAGFFVTNTPVNGPQAPNAGQTANVTITGGADVTGVNFGRLEANSIRGTVVHDFNGNGVADAGEPGLAGRVVFNDLNNNGVLNGGTVGAGTTGKVPDNSTVDFTAVASGFVGNVTNVRVVINEIKMTWVGDLQAVLVAPDGFTQAKLWTNKGGSGDDFINTIIDDSVGTLKIGDAGTAPPYTGVFLAEESLAIFNGLNGASLNGPWTLRMTDTATGDVASVNSWTLVITTDNALDIPEPNTITGPDGSYVFFNQTPGPFNIREVTPTGWNRLSPAGAISGTLPAGKASAGNNFYEARANAIYGNTYNDLDFSGTLNAGDAGLPDVFVYHDANNNSKYDQVKYASTDVPQDILDNATAFSSLLVSGFTGKLADINVTVNITHTWVGDMKIALTAPDGITTVVLANFVGGSQDNFIDTTFDDQAVTPIANGVAPFTGSFRPSESLATFNGIDPNGTWTMSIFDGFAGDTGTLNGWSINLSNEAATLSDANGNYILTGLDPAASPLTIRTVDPATFITNGEPVGGKYSVNLMAGQTVQNRNFGFIPDPRPIAVGSAAKVAAPGTTHTVTVVYTDNFNTVIDISSIGLDDIRVKAPDGSFLVPQSFVATPNTSAMIVSVDYVIPALGGSWDNTDNGIYEIEVVAGKVFDSDTITTTLGTGPYAVPAGKVGTFIVGLPTTYVVGKDGDQDDGITTTPADTTIVEALRLANSDFGDTTITFSLATGSAVFAKAADVNENLTIIGPAGGFTISGAGTDRLFNVDIPTSTFVLENLTLTGGNSTGDGGAILAVDENVTLNNVTVNGNTAKFGSAIAFTGTGGSLTLNKSTISTNTATQGGTIFFRGSTHLEMQKSIVTGNTGLVSYPSIVFYFTSSGSNSLNIGDSTISNNSGTNFSGGALYFYGPVGAKGATISNSLISNNKTNFGAGIGLFSMGTSTFNVVNTQILDNQANISGGGILQVGYGNLIVSNSTISGNKAGNGQGGGIWNNYFGNITVNNSTISNNESTKSGGGIYMGYGGSLVVDRSTVSGNKSNTTTANTYGGGGGIYFFGGADTFTITNSTISGNSTNSGGFDSPGGGIALVYFYGTLNIQNTTITGNEAGLANGDGIARTEGDGTVNLSSTIVAQNGDPLANTQDMFFDTPTNVAGNFNLIGVADVGNFTLTGTNNLTGTSATPLDAKLGPLALNGAPAGSPLTHRPLAGSPAINQGFNGSSLTTDQRGGARTVGTGIGASDGTDIGAVEIQAAPTATILTNGVVTGQHSMVTSIVINFDQPVTITNPSTAFQIFRTFGPLGDSATGTVGYTVSGLDMSNQGTSVTLTFNNSGTLGATDPGGSLRDGKYTVTVFAAGITGLDTAMVANQTANTWRLYGDANGDGSVTAIDFLQFFLGYGQPAMGTPATFDFNNDGLVSAVDFSQFFLRYGQAGYNVP
jgi:subtilisin-like proprotein convertase family protein